MSYLYIVNLSPSNDIAPPNTEVYNGCDGLHV